MPFWNIEKKKDIAVYTTSEQISYASLQTLIEEQSRQLVVEKKELILLLCENTVGVLSTYLAALQKRHAVLLLDAKTNPELLNHIIMEYKPKWIYGDVKIDGYVRDGMLLSRDTERVEIHTDLAILLSTSGTTGSQKFVRLSYDNIQSNAESIVSYLHITEEERAIMNLPFSYSYGMSIINSHLQAGASILLTEESVMSKSFWAFVEEQKATSLAGVPFTYQMLQRIGFLKMELPYLKTLTQAGGRLNEKLVKMFGEYTQANDKRLYVMYGQTEAAPRMSYIPPERLLEKESSIGIAVPGGELSVNEKTSELIYKGPNVMMGYSECLEDLAKGNEQNGILYTGDTATLDEDGYFTITGRLKRFIKLFGLRINLDEVERKLESELQIPLACTGNDDRLIVAVEATGQDEIIKNCLIRLYKLHNSSFRVITLDVIPRFPNGKTDYRTLKDVVL